MRTRYFIPIVATAALAAASPAARAAERIALRNGFDLRCDHHALVENRIRLYLTAGNDNYVELSRGDIADVETVPDLPSLPPSAAPQDKERSHTETRLTPADLNQMLVRASHRHNIDVDLLACVVKAESGGNARAVSRTGARGLMQLMPSTAAQLGVDDSFQPGENVRGGSTYLDALLTRYHDNLALALAAYNAGPAAVDKYHGIPPYHETRAYVARVIHEFNRRVHARLAAARKGAITATASASR